MTSYIETGNEDVIVSRIVRVEGWIASSNPIQSLNISVNGRQLDFLELTHRDDVQKATGASYSTGWVVHYEPAAYVSMHKREILLEIHANDVLLSRSSHRYIPMRTGSSPLLYFMHIPKTAGSSMRVALERASDIRLLRIYQSAPYVRREQIEQFSLNAMDDVDIAYGHFAYGIHTASHRNFNYMTFVRNPRDHLISCYFYMKYVIADPRLAECRSIFEAIESLDEITFDNYQVRFIAGHVGPEPVTREHLDIAIDNIIKTFLYVGRVEDFATSLENISAHIGVRLPITRENVTPPNQEMHELDLRRVENLTAFRNQFDIALYRFVEKRFAGLCWFEDYVPNWSSILADR
ncbi:hypothetical protein ACMDCR_08190 [Labrys okinawensis]|uniref:hypothetical protein n=1 Tax=Labrys okinawensis TaxID=346911 RepID=UPI0039BD1D94